MWGKLGDRRRGPAEEVGIKAVVWLLSEQARPTDILTNVRASILPIILLAE